MSALHVFCPAADFLFTEMLCSVVLSLQLAVANNRIITLQEDVERVKEESSYQLESRKVLICQFMQQLTRAFGNL